MRNLRYQRACELWYWWRVLPGTPGLRESMAKVSRAQFLSPIFPDTLVISVWLVRSTLLSMSRDGVNVSRQVSNCLFYMLGWIHLMLFLAIFKRL